MFGLPPTDCAENFTPECYNNIGGGGGGFYITPHFGANYGQYNTYYTPINNNQGGGGNSGGGGVIQTIQQVIANVTTVTTTPSNITATNDPFTPAPQMATPIQNIIAKAKANPLLTLAIVGGLGYAIFKG